MDDRRVDARRYQRMAALRATDGLIIDVRNNNGGDRVNATGIVSRFIETPPSYLSAIDRDGVDNNVAPPVQPVPGWPAYRRPVVVLINGAAISAADLFAALMRQDTGAEVC